MRERERERRYIGSKSLANYNLRMMKNIPDHRDLVDPDTWNNDCRCGSCFVGPVSLSQIIVTLFGSGRVYIYMYIYTHIYIYICLYWACKLYDVLPNRTADLARSCSRCSRL